MGTNQRNTRRSTRILQASTIVVILATTGCGALIDRAVEGGLETVVEEGIEAAVEADSGEDFELDLDLGDGSVEFEVDGASGSFGGNLERPDWLDDDYDLPSDLIVGQQIVNENGTQQIGGLIEGQSIADIEAQQLDTIENMGFTVEQFEALGGNSGLATHPDGRALELLMFGQAEAVIFTVIFYDAGTQGADSVVSRIEQLQQQAEDAG